MTYEPVFTIDADCSRRIPQNELASVKTWLSHLSPSVALNRVATMTYATYSKIVYLKIWLEDELGQPIRSVENPNIPASRIQVERGAPPFSPLFEKYGFPVEVEAEDRVNSPNLRSISGSEEESSTTRLQGSGA